MILKQRRDRTGEMASRRTCGFAAVLMALFTAGHAAAQTASPSLDDLRRLIDEQRVLLDRQAERLDEQGRELTDLRKRLDEVSPPPPAIAAAAGQQPATEQTATADRTSEQRAAELSTRRNPELPAVSVSAGDFPGSIRVPGTNTAIKVGGQARMTLVHTLAPLGVDDRFITSSIPVEGSEVAGEAARAVYTPIASRINLDVRTPTDVGEIRAFIEWDFANTNDAARLRHAFIQAKRWLIGQTWSTFSDPEADPIGIDFEGLNAISRLRQTQIRFTQPLGTNVNVSVAIENPAPALTGATGVTLVPDFVTRLRWERPEDAPGPHLLGHSAHVQAAVIVRSLRGELTNDPTQTLSTGGFGGNVSGVLVPNWAAGDRVKFAANAGKGIGRYITDLGALGGQDAFYDPATATLTALPVFSSYIGYEHLWNPKITSTFTYGLVTVDNLDAQPGDSLRRTDRASVNVMWVPISQLELVLEFLAGRRENKDGSSANSSQIQAGWTYRF
jgi:DcaP outer membrane protein